MNIELEKIGGKMFQFCPQRTGGIPCHIHIDNNMIAHMFTSSKEKNEYIGHFLETKVRDELWEKCFNMKAIYRIKNKLKGFSFDYAFHTNGFDVSLRFVQDDTLATKNQVKKNMAQGKADTLGFTSEERETRHNEKEKALKKVKEENDKEENTKDTKSQKKQEFPYIDDVSLELLKGKKYVVVDPGKHDLLSMMDSEGKQLKYSKRQRDHETKRFKLQTLNFNYRKKLGILKIEETLNGLNVKTCDIDGYKNYLKIKTEANSSLLDLYAQPKFRKLKFFSFIQHQRADAKLLNLIKKTYFPGKKVNNKDQYNSW
jgi:hypothetical protein